MNSALTAVRGLTLHAAFHHIAERYTCRLALSSPKQAVKRGWGELRFRVDAVAAALVAHGVERGGRTGAGAATWPEWIELQLGIARAGAIAVYGVDSPGIGGWEAFLERGRSVDHAELDARCAAVRPEDAAAELACQGPGALVTHAELLGSAGDAARALALTARDTLCLPASLKGAASGMLGTLMCCVTGAAALIVEDGWRPESDPGTSAPHGEFKMMEHWDERGRS